MAFVLPQAPPAGSHQLAAKGAVSLKVPAALVPLKPGAEAPGQAAPKSKFQALLDQLSQAVKAPDPAADKTKAKVKVEAAEKPKDPKKPEKADLKDPKETRSEAYEAAWALVHAPVPPKTEAPKAKPEADALQGALEKAKMPLRDRKTGLEVGVPAAVTAASVEVARAQAQQNAPRSERSEERQRVFVVDRRTDAKEKEKLKLPGAEAAAQQPVNAAVELPAQQTKVADPKAAAEVQVNFQSVSGKNREGFDLKPQSAPVSPRDALTFQQYLVEKGYGQLVDQARIVLKDQNAGEIRMTLYPESLGKVKVALDLSDNTLAGQIFVENQTVKEVFQSNLDGLMQAFREGGYSDLSLQVSVGNGNGGNQAREGASESGAQARGYGRHVSQTGPAEVRGDRIGSWTDRQINLTA